MNRRLPARLRRASVPLLAGLLALAPLAAFADGEHRLIPGQSAFGVISEDGEEDLIEVFAFQGQKITIAVKARAGESLLPVITAWEDPDEVDLLPGAKVKVAKKGNAVTLSGFLATKSGVHVLRIAGDASSTGTYDIKSKGAPANFALGSGTVTTASEEVAFQFPAEADSVVTLLVKAAKGSALQPLMAGLDGPESEVDLAGGMRKTSTKKDQVKNLTLPDNGLHTLRVTGAEGTTGAFTVQLKVGKVPAVDFSVDPPVEPGTLPPVIGSVGPTSFDIPSTGNSLSITGSRFENGASVTFSPSSDIASVVTQFNSANSLTVTFDVLGSAAPGDRSLTVTNPGLLAATRNNAITLVSAPVGLQLYSVTPNEGSGDGGTRVLLHGDNIAAITAVTFGGVSAHGILRVDAENVLCTVPPAASLSRTAGTAVDVVLEVNGTESKTLIDGFTYAPDPTGPQVLSAVPALGATGVATNLHRFVFVLDGRVDPATVVVGNFDFFRSGASGPNDISNPHILAAATGPGDRVVVIQRGAASGGTMSTNSVYLPNIDDTVLDPAGNPFDPTPFGGSTYQASFTTGTAADNTAPTLVSSNPANNAVDVAVDATLTLQFSEPVDPSALVGAVTLKQGINTLPSYLEVDATLMNVVITPRFALLPSTVYTIQIATTLRDLSNNPIGAVTRTFTTAAADTTAPTVALTVDALPDDVNGSGTFVNDSGVGGNAFDVHLPRNDFTIDLVFSDLGGSAVDASSLLVTSNKAMGGVNAGQNLASLFTTTALGARWTVPGTHALAVSANVSFSATISDYAGNTSSAATLVVDVSDITKTITGANGNAGNDRNPFNTRQVWLLRFDQDIWTITSSSGGGSNIVVTSTLSGNGTSDFREDLTLIGLNGTESGTNAATVSNGGSTGTNAIVQRLVREAVRGRMNERYGLAYDGTRGADSVDIEFLLAGEQGSLASVPDPGTWTAGKGYSMMTFTGDERANSNNAAIGRANFDLRNTSEDNDSNTGNATGLNLGTFGTHMARVRLNDFSGTLFRDTFDPLIATSGRGGTPVGTSNLDGVVLAGSFNYAGATQGQKDRFDLIMGAIDTWALYLSLVGAHEVGHSVGLVADGAPPVGLFGGGHEGNSFIVDGGFTTSGHIDTPGGNVMEAAASFTSSVATGSSFAGFGPLNLAYLLRRMIYDQ